MTPHHSPQEARDGDGWCDEGLSGPPTREDDWWFLEHVVSRGYPKPRRDPEPMPGQTKLVWPDGPISLKT